MLIWLYVVTCEIIFLYALFLNENRKGSNATALIFKVSKFFIATLLHNIYFCNNVAFKYFK